MKITLESNYSKVTVEVKQDDLNVGQVVENLFRPAMLAQGYQNCSLDKEIGISNDDNLIIDHE